MTALITLASDPPGRRVSLAMVAVVALTIAAYLAGHATAAMAGAPRAAAGSLS